MVPRKKARITLVDITVNIAFLVTIATLTFTQYTLQRNIVAGMYILLVAINCFIEVRPKH